MQRNNIIDISRYPRRIADPPRPDEHTVVLAFPRPVAATREGGELPPAA